MLYSEVDERMSRSSQVHLGDVAHTSSFTIFNHPLDAVQTVNIDSIQIINGTSFTKSDTDYVTFKVIKTGVDGTDNTKVVDETNVLNTTKLLGSDIDANVPLELTLVAGANVLEPGESLVLTITSVGNTTDPTIWDVTCVADVDSGTENEWEVTCVADVADFGNENEWEITCVADVYTSATPTVWTLECVADVAASLDGKYFVLEDDAGTVGFWIDVDDGGGTAPAGALACDRQLEITTITTGMTAAQVAGVVATAIDNDSKFIAGAGGKFIVISSSTNDNYTAGDAGDSGFELNVSDPGNVASNSLDGTYFILEDDVGTVAFWIDVDNSGTAEPSHGADRAVEITTVTGGMTASQVGGVIATAIHADAKFSATNVDELITVVSSTKAPYTTEDAGTSGFTVEVSVTGVIPSNSLDGTYFILEDNVGTVAFWIDVDNSGTAEPSHGADRAVEITTVTGGMTASQVGGVIATAIHADAKFSATNVDELITVVSSTQAPYATADAGTSGFTVEVSVTGVVTASSLNGKYFVLEDDAGTVAFWFDVDGGTLEPANTCDRAVEITTVTKGDSANTVAGLVRIAVHNDSKFNATVLNAVVTVTSTTNDNYIQGDAGDSGFTVTVTQAGGDGASLSDLTRILINTKFIGKI